MVAFPPPNGGPSPSSAATARAGRHHGVHASPAFCCPGLVTEALGPQVERITGVPMVSVTYDGTDTSKNDVVIPYLKFPRHRQAMPLIQDELAIPSKNGR